MKAISKTIVITGSSKGFGKELAKEFLNKGHNVVICSKSSENIDSVSLELKKYDNILPLVIDVQNYDDCKELHYQSIKRFNSVDILINNAATNLNTRQDFLLFNNTDIDTIVETNMIGKNGGVIINVEGSGSRPFDETTGYSIYSSTKAALTSFTNTLRKEYNNTNVHFCTLSPGMMHTDVLWTKNTTSEMEQIFNIFGEYPDIVAKVMVDEILQINENKHLEYLTWSKIISKMMTHVLFNQFKKD